MTIHGNCSINRTNAVRARSQSDPGLKYAKVIFDTRPSRSTLKSWVGPGDEVNTMHIVRQDVRQVFREYLHIVACC